MFVKIHLLSITAFLTFLTAVKCVTSRDNAFWTSSATKSLRGPKRSVTSVDNENINLRSRRNFESMNEFRTKLKNVEKTQMVHYDKKYDDINDKFLRHNFLKCPPCKCQNISSHLISVVCKNCPFTNVPSNWSIELYEVILYHCKRLEVFDLGNLLVYTSLTRVKATSSNFVKILSSSHLNVSSKIIEMDLSHNLIQIIEDNAFLFFTNLQILSLNWNKLNNLTKQMFTGLYNLTSLSVSRNYINFIANDTFDDMGKLIVLDISYNKFIYIDHYLLPGRIFKALINLQQLYINDLCYDMSHQCSTYTNEALKVLTKLQLLMIDGDDRRGLGPEFKSLGKLRMLIIKFSNVYNFTNETYFENVPFITTLQLSEYVTNNLHPEAFKKLTNLVNLTYSLTRGKTNLCQILSDIQYFFKSSLQYLKLKKVNHRNCGCKELRKEDAKYLQLFTLFELYLSGNYLLYVSPGFIKMLPESLKKIDLSLNSFSREIISILYLFPKELIELDLSDQRHDFYACHDDDEMSQRCVVKNKENSSKFLISSGAISKKSFKQQELKYNKSKHNIKTSEYLDYYLPRNLRILRSSHFISFGSEVLAPNIFLRHSLKELTLARVDFDTWSLHKISAEIEKANFNSNYAKVLNRLFFPKNSSLQYLSVSNNLFGDALQYDPDRLFFANTEQLIVLNMKQNFITDLAHDYFRNLFKLITLEISRNKLQLINISFSHMTELRFLDFSKNSITSISKRSRDDLDLIAADHRVYLDLTSNPLPCTCEGLELMKWMAFTNVYLLNQDFLVCRNEFDQVLEIGNIVQRVETLQRQCASKTVIIITSVFSIIVFGILLITSLMYRYRWKLRYLRSISLIKLLGSRAGATNKIVYRFDAYILYTDDTRRFVLRDCVRELEEKRGHRLCIEERDFLPGTYIVSNIVSGVQNSTKMVAMVKPEYYQGEYSEYSVKMALMEEIFMRRSVLFLCVCEPTDDKDLSHDLLTAMKQNKYIEYPPRDDVTDEIIEEFWNQFSRAIGRSERQEIEVVVSENIQ